MTIPTRELVNLDVTLAEFLLPRLEAFRDTTETYPSNLNTLDDWRAELTDMLSAWAAVAELGDLDDFDHANLRLFIDRLGHLWL